MHISLNIVGEFCTCLISEYVTLYSQWYFADFIKIKISLDFPGWINVVTSVLIRQRGGKTGRVREGDVRMGAEYGEMRGHEPRNAGSLLKWEKSRKQILP